jgi:hypothetical protein
MCSQSPPELLKMKIHAWAFDIDIICRRLPRNLHEIIRPTSSYDQIFMQMRCVHHPSYDAFHIWSSSVDAEPRAPRIHGWGFL